MFLALAIVLGVVRTIVIVFVVLMWARFVFDWVRVLARDWRPHGFLLVLAEIVYTATDPPIRLLRRIIPPLRLGPVAIDFAWLIVMVACWVILALI